MQACSLSSVPLWLHLAAMRGKKSAWIIGMAAQGASFSIMLPYVSPHWSALMAANPNVRLGLALLTGGLVGASAACGQVISRSLMADVVDDEAGWSGDRRDGAFFAWFNFLSKSAGGVGAMLMGWLLDASGFVPNVEQSRRVKLTMVSLFSLLPMVGFAVAVAVFKSFSLVEQQPRTLPYAPPRFRHGRDGQTVALM